MKQAVLQEPGHFEITESPSLTPKANEVVVSVKYCGVCGSDVHAYLGKHPRAQYPWVFGHEASGIIKVAGENVTDITAGQPVAIIPLVGCKECAFCRQGRPNLCKVRNVIGYQRPGCLSEEVIVPSENVIPLKSDEELLAAALLEPLAVAVRSTSFLDRLQTSAKEILVTGGGAIGATVAMALVKTTSMKVTVLEKNPQRLKTLQQLSIATITDLADYQPGDSRIICCECSGSEFVFNALMDRAEMLEALIITSVFDKEFSIPLLELTKSEVIFVGSQMYTFDDFHKAASLLDAEFSRELLKLVDDTIYPLAETGEAFEASMRPQTKNKVLIKVGN